VIQIDEEGKEPMLRISEMFGPTLQGEGRNQGRPAAFVRFGLCNLDCSWCDTPYTWDWRGKNGIVFDPKEEIHRIPLSDVLLWAAPFYRIIISGGEPLVQKKNLGILASALLDQGKAVEVETNGSLDPSGLDERISFCVSPKIDSSGVAWNKAINISALRNFQKMGASYKFVIGHRGEIRSVKQIQADAEIDNTKIWLMPEGRTKEEIIDRLPWLFEICSIEGWNLSTRLQVLAFDDRRGI
jgi:organic radical activating enzyme